jgi:hypothetical protein
MGVVRWPLFFGSVLALPSQFLLAAFAGVQVPWLPRLAVVGFALALFCNLFAVVPVVWLKAGVLAFVAFFLYIHPPKGG